MDETKKTYIRTLAGDIEAIKKGGTPEFSPLRERPTAPVQPTAPLPPSGEPSVPAPLSKIPLIPPTPSIPPVASVPLETYEGDFSDRMKEKEASTATVLAAEQDAAPILVQDEPKKPATSSILYSIAGGVLIIAGAIGVYVAYGRYLSVSAPIVLAPAEEAPIFVDDREKISGTGTALVREIEQSVTRTLASGTVRLLSLEGATDSTDSPRAATSVFAALQEPAPGTLLRNIDAARSMAGVVNTGGVQSPFFILSVTAYGETFSGMLQWEATMPRDLEKLFPPYPQPLVGTTTVAMSTPVSVLSFHDEVVSNHDTRAYRDSAGRVILLYGYWNQTTLVLARDPAAFAEILRRLATSRAQ